MKQGTAAGRRLESALRKQAAVPLAIEVLPAQSDSMLKVRIDSPGRQAVVESLTPSGPVMVTIGGHTLPAVVRSEAEARLMHLTPSEIASAVLELLQAADSNAHPPALLLAAKAAPATRSPE